MVVKRLELGCRPTLLNGGCLARRWTPICLGFTVEGSFPLYVKFAGLSKTSSWAKVMIYLVKTKTKQNKKKPWDSPEWTTIQSNFGLVGHCIKKAGIPSLDRLWLLRWALANPVEQENWWDLKSDNPVIHIWQKISVIARASKNIDLEHTCSIGGNIWWCERPGFWWPGLCLPLYNLQLPPIMHFWKQCCLLSEYLLNAMIIHPFSWDLRLCIA